MLNIDEIREALQDRLASVVAEKTGLSRNTVAAIKSGNKMRANAATLLALSNYLRKGAGDADE